jgi:uncharacterized protein (TIGR03066 family)
MLLIGTNSKHGSLGWAVPATDSKGDATRFSFTSALSDSLLAAGQHRYAVVIMVNVGLRGGWPAQASLRCLTLEVRMTTSRLLVAGVVVLALAAGAGAEDRGDAARLLVGKWQTTKAHKVVPVGTVFEFSKDGKMRVNLKDGGKEESVEGICKVEGDKVQYTLKLGGKDEKKDPLTIKKISEQELVLKGVEGDLSELKRIK